MADDGWHPVEGFEPDTAKFPARARVDGEDILVIELADGYRGVQRFCPHQGVNLARSLIIGDGAMIRCAQHAFTFRLADGKGVNCPGFAISVYDIARDGDRFVGRRAGEG